MELASTRICNEDNRSQVAVCKLADCRNHHRDVWSADRHFRFERRLALLGTKQWLVAAKLGARRNAQHCDQQHPAWIFLQSVRLRAARRGAWATGTKLKRNSRCWS